MCSRGSTNPQRRMLIMNDLYEKMAQELIKGNEAEVKNLTQEALDKGAVAKDVLDNGLLAGMDVVGKRFKAGDMFIPEVLLCARTMHAAMDILKPQDRKSVV